MFQPQKGEAITKVTVTFPKSVSVKLDGIRTVTKFGGALSKTLKPVPNHYIRELLAPWQELDGEVISGPPNDPLVYNKTFRAWRTEKGEPEFTYYVFDELSRPELPHTDRQKILYDRGPSLPDFIKILPQTWVLSEEGLQDYYGEVLEDGYEGLMLLDPLAPYKYGRWSELSQGSLKMKPHVDEEAEIVEVFEAMQNNNEAFKDELGRSKRSTHKENLSPKGIAGGFIARDLKTNVVFRVSAGFSTHTERALWWKYKEQLRGKIIKYRRLTIGTLNAPRHGRFISWKHPLDI